MSKSLTLAYPIFTPRPDSSALFAVLFILLPLSYYKHVIIPGLKLMYGALVWSFMSLFVVASHSMIQVYQLCMQKLKRVGWMVTLII